ncbi:MAG TPA: Holliday junction resolvase RuvX [Trueperaceae bacterium]|nr:Holliday junction resolvase RuvX [Trueperaceae bacterium]
MTQGSTPATGTTVLALDVGEARIGLARGQVGSSLAFGRGALDRRGTKTDVTSVASAARAEGATIVLVGLPLNLDGTDSAQTAKVRAFAVDLGGTLEPLGIAVALEDERLTTRMAQRQIGTGPLPRGKRQVKGLLDEAAAVLILESYLARTMDGPEP